MRRLGPLLGLLLLAACGRGAERSTPAADSARGGLVVDPATVAGRMALELWQLRGGLTLEAWRLASPEDAVLGSDSSPLAEHLGPWCAISVRRFRAGTHAVERRAYFYPPVPPPDLVLPDSAPDLILGCTLGLIWVSTPAPAEVSGALLADSVRTQLGAAYGGTQAGSVSFFGSAYWVGVGRYRQDSVTAVSALVSGPGLSLSTDSTSARQVFAFAFLPVTGIAVDAVAPVAPDTSPPTPPDLSPLDSLVREAALDSALWRPLRDILELAGDPARLAVRKPGPADSLASALRRWLAASAGLGGARRAAALFVADRVLTGVEGLYLGAALTLEDSAVLRPFRDLGAAFGYSELGGGWAYERSWLTLARTLDRDSPLGQRIFLEQLASGFDFSGTCREGSEGFRRVIENGERYLERVPESPIAPEVHFQVAEAYRDIVALANGAMGLYADASRYAAEAPEARHLAVQHYRAAIAAGRGTSTASAAWQRAWWLQAGVSPRDVKFLCIYD